MSIVNIVTEYVNLFTIDELLAKVVRSYPVLYDKTLKNFKDNNVKENEWKTIAALDIRIRNSNRRNMETRLLYPSCGHKI